MRIAIDGAADHADFSQDPGRADVVVLQAWERDKLRAMKAATPDQGADVPQPGAMSRADRWGNTGTGVTTQDAEATPSGTCATPSGDRFTFSSYDYLWAADIGNRSFQERWLANVTAKLKTADWDGVLVDDANPTMHYHYDVGRIAKYPSDAAYSAATGSALAFIGPRLRAQGKLVIPNFGDWRRYRSTVTPWLKYVSGGMEEHFTKYGDSPAEGHFTGADWDDQLAVLKQVQSMGKLFLGVSHSSLGDRAPARYGWATMLLAAEGSASFALHDDYTREAWFPEYGYDLGAPKGKESEVADGIHRRVFEHGLVLVNPTKERRRSASAAATAAPASASPAAPCCARTPASSSSRRARARSRAGSPRASGVAPLAARPCRLPCRRAPVPPHHHRRRPRAGSARRRRPPQGRRPPHGPRAGAPELQGPRRAEARPAPARQRPRPALSSA